MSTLISNSKTVIYYFFKYSVLFTTIINKSSLVSLPYQFTIPDRKLHYFYKMLFETITNVYIDVISGNLAC